MKKQSSIVLLAVVSLFLIVSCQTQQQISGPGTDENKGSEVLGEVFQPIYAGQNILIGQVSVINDEDNFYITYVIENPDWWLDLTHIHIATTLAGIPRNGAGIPVPGRFAYQTVHDPAVQDYVYVIPRTAFKNKTEVVFAIHADVRKTNPTTGETIQEETAWAGDIRGPGSRWWFYFKYRLQEPWRSIDNNVISSQDTEITPTLFGNQ